MRRRLRSLLGSFRINDRNGNANDNALNLIGRVWKNNRAARAARSYEQVRPSSEKQQREITTFTVLMNT